MPLITIRGKIGSGAPEIGQIIAKRLHIDFIDGKIIADVAVRLHLQEREVAAKELPPCTLRGQIGEALTRGYTTGVGLEGAWLPIWQIPLDDHRYLDALTSLIKELAQGRSAVIFGRGGQFILREYPNVINVSVVAPFNTRLKRVIDVMGCNEDRAKSEITRMDNSMREFYRRYFKAEMEDPCHYDLVINTERLDYDTAASIILTALHVKVQDHS
jgi:cytidylate kinase